MQVLLDNKKISNFIFIQDGMNSLGYESLNEVFFDVFEIKSNGIDLIKEKKGDFNGNPIIELDLCLNKEIYKNVRFVLKENAGISINPNLLDYTKAIVLENSQKQEKPKELPKPTRIIETPVIKPKKIITETKQVKTEKTLLEKTKEQFFNSIKGELIESLKEEIKAGIIADLLKDNVQSNFDNIVEENSNQYKLQKLFRNENNKFRKDLIEMSEKIARRESMRFSESGGGTNAVQYANGGTMNGDLNVTGKLQSSTMSVDRLDVNNLTVTENITANSILLYDSLSAANNIRSYNSEFYNSTVSNLLSVNSAIVDTNLTVDKLTANYATINYDLTVNRDITAYNAYVYNQLSSNNLQVQTSITTDTITANYGTINHDLSVLGKLYADQAAITNNLTVGGGVSSYNGSYVLGDVVITGNLTVSQEIFGDLVSGNTIVNSSGDTLLAKAVKNISGSSFVNGNYTVQHNLSSYDLLLTLYYVNPNGTREVVHASMINDTLSTTQISFANQPDPSDAFKLVIMS